MLFKQSVEATGLPYFTSHVERMMSHVIGKAVCGKFMLLRNAAEIVIKRSWHNTFHMIWWKWKKIGFSSRGLAFKLHLAAAAAAAIHCFKVLMPNKPLRYGLEPPGNLLQFFSRRFSQVGGWRRSRSRNKSLSTWLNISKNCSLTLLDIWCRWRLYTLLKNPYLTFLSWVLAEFQIDSEFHDFLMYVGSNISDRDAGEKKSIGTF